MYLLKNLTRRLLLSGVALAALCFIAAAQDGFRFRHLTTSDGLADNTVWTVCQDRTGFIWLGTNDGLYRYDGSRLEAVRRNFLTDHGRGNAVASLAEDSVRRLMWVGTGAGLFAWNMECDTLMRPAWSQPARELLQADVSSVATDRSGRLLVAIAGRGVYRMGSGGGDIFNSEPEQLLAVSDAFDLQPAGGDSVRILTYNNGVWLYDGTSDPEICFSGVGGLISFLRDSDGTVWAGSYDGLWCQTPSDSVPRRIELREEPDVSRLTVNGIARRDSSTLCLATSHGLFLYSPSGGRSYQLKADIGVDGSLNCDYLNRLFFDREHTLWIATYFGGVNYLPAGNRNISSCDFLNYRIEGRVVSAFAEEADGTLWIGTEDGGLSRYEPSTGKVTNFNPKKQALKVPAFHNIHALMIHDGRLYVGMSTGAVDILHPASGRSSHLDISDGLLSNTVYSFGSDSAGNVWIGTTAGLNRYDPASGRLTAETGVPQKRINCIVEDSRGNLWVCGENLGVYCRQASDGRWTDFRGDDETAVPREVYTLAVDGDLVYIGAQNEGVFCYDTRLRKLSRLPVTGIDDQIVYRIVPYGKELWIATGRGLMRHSLRTGATEVYTTDDGLKTEQMNLNAGIRLHDGSLMFGTVAGLNGFHPDRLLFNPHEPEVVATHLYLNNEPVSVLSPDSPLECSLPFTRNLVIDSKYTSISIRFAALTYTGKAGYLYRLEPFDKEWIEADGSSPVATYTNLPAGDYVFRVKARNSDGVWNEHGYSLDIKVLPPWWAAWYTKAACVLACIVMAVCGLMLLRRRHRKQLELLEARKTKELYDSKMEFFTHLVHEIRTPLTLIISPVEQLMARVDSLPFRKELQMVNRNSNRLLELVNRMMDFRKLEARGFELSPSEVDLRELTRQLCDDFEPSAAARGVALDLRLPDMAACNVMADREALTKMLTNLLSNALKFTRSRIAVELAAGADGSRWRLVVTDDGPGIAPEEQKRIFEPFYQVREQLPSDYIGTGIGLSLVRSLAERSGGSVSVDSAVGRGSTFTLDLPACGGVVAPAAEPAAGAALTESSGPSVVVVEDNADMRDFLVSILQPDYSVRAYGDAASALRALNDAPADIVVSDVMMPGMDGYELCRRLKSNLPTSHVAVVLLTARTADADRIEGLGRGADAYLTKPFSPDVLKAQLASLLDNRRRILQRFRSEPDVRLSAPTRSEADAEFIRRMDEIIVSHMADSELSVATMLKELVMSRTAFFTKVKAVAGMTFTDYVRIMRLKRAAELFNSGNTYIGDVAYRTGFSSPSYFCNCFRKQFGLTPSEYIRRRGLSEHPADSAPEA